LSMAKTLSESIRECLELRDRKSIEKMFDRARSAVEEYIRKDAAPVPCRYRDNRNSPDKSLNDSLPPGK